jgi:hypothetical protein
LAGASGFSGSTCEGHLSEAEEVLKGRPLLVTHLMQRQQVIRVVAERLETVGQFQTRPELLAQRV